MNAATVNALISGSAGLLGAVIGALTTYFGGTGQHRRQVKKERQDAQRDREHTAAEKCEMLCVQMADYIEKARHPAAQSDDADTEREKRVDKAYRELTAAVLYLPADLRQRIELIGEVIRNADDLSYGSPMSGENHYDQPYTICRYSRKEVWEAVAAFLKSEPIPKLSPRMIEYQVALDDLNKDRDEYYSTYDDTPPEKAHQRRREDFYKRHPALRCETN